MTEIKVCDKRHNGDWTIHVKHKRRPGQLLEGELTAIEMALTQMGLYDASITLVEMPLADASLAVRCGVSVASDVHSWLQSAAMDCANEGKADELYNRDDWLCDMAGDRICDELGQKGYQHGRENYSDAFNAAVLELERLHPGCDLAGLLKTPPECEPNNPLFGWRDQIMTRIGDQLAEKGEINWTVTMH